MDSPPVLMDEKLLLDVLRKKDITLEDVGEVVELRLEFKRILKIALLNEFTHLAKLNLNANYIEKIESLEYLVNLKWLSLSYNRIKKIEGLESLRKLEVLQLSNNRISVIENMDTLENLTHFAIANNLISQMDNVMYLRRFKKLFQVYFFGNPISEENEYVMFIAAFLPTLRGLDKTLFDKKTKDKAYAKYKFTLDLLELKDLQKQQAAAAQMRKEAELKLHKDAFVESFNGPCLFKSMFENDPEAATLSRVPGMASHLQAFEDQMVKLFMSLFDTGLAEHKRRETEVNAYLSGQDDTLTYYRQEALQMMEKYDEQYEEVVLKVMRLSNPELINAEIKPCGDEISPLIKNLKTLNSELMTNLMGNIRTFDTCISEMVDDFCKTAKEIFDQCRDLENDYHHKVQETAVEILEKVALENLEEDMLDEVATDKNAVLSPLSTSHDNHLLKISDWENQLLTRVNAWKVALVIEFEEKEVIRDSVRFSDILRYEKYLKERLHKASESARRK